MLRGTGSEATTEGIMLQSHIKEALTKLQLPGKFENAKVGFLVLLAPHCLKTHIGDKG